MIIAVVREGLKIAICCNQANLIHQMQKMSEINWFIQDYPWPFVPVSEFISTAIGALLVVVV